MTINDFKEASILVENLDLCKSLVLPEVITSDSNNDVRFELYVDKYGNRIPVLSAKNRLCLTEKEYLLIVDTINGILEKRMIDYNDKFAKL